jgi:hypothetical protein
MCLINGYELPLIKSAFLSTISQALGIDTQQAGNWIALAETHQETISLIALWGLVQWLGQLSPAQLNLALGVEPPPHIIEDEKHMKECGQILSKVIAVDLGNSLFGLL